MMGPARMLLLPGKRQLAPPVQEEKMTKKIKLKTRSFASRSAFRAHAIPSSPRNISKKKKRLIRFWLLAENTLDPN